MILLKKEIFVLIFLALIVPCYILWKNTFPAFDYFLDKANNHGITIKSKNFDKNTFLLNPYYKKNPFSRVDLKLKISENYISKLKQPLVVSVFENYEAMAYPREGVIVNAEELRKYLFYENQSTLPNGTIFSNDESAFFISRGEYRPILASEIFEKLGFDWKVIIPQEADIFSILEKEGEKIVFNSAHPDGTILKIEEKIYLVWEEKLIEIKNKDILAEVWHEYYLVSTDELVELDSCSPEINKNREIECSFDVSNSLDSNLPYLFKFNQIEMADEIASAETTLKVSAKVKDAGKSFFILLSDIKQRLVGRYGGYLF